jgi:hypothetical protein
VGVYSIRLGRNPILASQEYVNVLRAQFGGEAFPVGVFELRPLIHLLIPGFAAAEIVNTAVILVLAGAVLLVAVKKARSDRRERDLVLLQLCSLFGLMAVFHNPYDSILLLPVMFGLYRTVETAASDFARRSARIALWILQAALLIEVAGRWRALSGRFGLSDYQLLGSLISQVDRLLLLGLFVFVVAFSGVTRWTFRMPMRLRERDAET